MIKKISSISTIFVLLLYNYSCQSNEKISESPKLVVLISIDGLGANLLNRYDSIFQGGFRRLKNQGMRFDNAVVDHAITVSHAGHVTLSTGNNPSKHGLVDAAFYVPIGDTRVLVDALDDSSEIILGESNSLGVSPKKILTSGLGEWIEEADQNSRSLFISSGFPTSLLYSSTSPGDVYWYSRSSGKYVTSTYYKEEYPDWVNEFNTKTLPEFQESSKKWTCNVPLSIRNLARMDKSKYEADGVYISFPHLYEEELAEEIPTNKDAIFKWFGWTPISDAATLSLAKIGIKMRLLGQRESIDYLLIVLSQIDSACHYYGPNSLEAMDAILRLDDELGKFFAYLDDTIGPEKYVLSLSADHGFPVMPEYQSEPGLEGRRITEKEIETLLDETESNIGESSVFSEAVAHKVVELSKKYDFVADAYSPEQLLSASQTEDEFLQLYRNSYREDRIPRLPLFSLNTYESSVGKAGVMLRLKKGSMIDLGTVIHGSPYIYDRHVPIYFLGAGVKQGNSLRSASTKDVAPTLAALAGIKFPKNLDGKPLIGFNK